MDSVLDKLSELSRIWRQTTDLESRSECLNEEEFDIFKEKQPELEVSSIRKYTHYSRFNSYAHRP
jgi:hypothetical protein